MPVPAIAIGFDEWEAIKVEQARLSSEIERLKALVQRLAGELGTKTEQHDSP